MTGRSESIIRYTSISGLLIVKRPTFYDERGFFREVVRISDLERENISFTPVQVNHSKSFPRVLRALHAEEWNKLVFPVTGKMFSAVVDIRPESDSFSKIETFKFSADDPYALFISKGLANSVCVLGNTPVHYIYLTDAYYTRPGRAIAWNDPDLAIDWPVKNPIISDRDRNNPRLRDLFPEKFQ